MNGALHPNPWHRPGAAIALEIWSRYRAGILALLISLPVAGGLNWILARNGARIDLLNTLGSLLLILSIGATFGFFHYTEGERKGGFGHFPIRLFRLPVATGWLVAWPMIYGILAVVGVYLLASFLIFRPLGRAPTALWACLYLASSVAQFQMILWSFPNRRYVKLFSLSAAAGVLTIGWMFFLPDMIEGTLEELGYPGSPGTFQQYLCAALFMSIPAAYGVSLARIRKQRHASADPRGGLAAAKECLVHLFPTRTQPFATPEQALFWHEWRQTGLILPSASCVLLALTCVPSYLFGPVTARETFGILCWIFLSPVLLALIIGRGFAKADFWNGEIQLAPFYAVRPIASGPWVITKMKVAGWSVALAWVLSAFVSFLWTAHAGDFEAFEILTWEFWARYPGWEGWALLLGALMSGMLLTWRFLVSGMAVALSGRKAMYYAANGVTAGFLVAVIALMIWRGDREDHTLRLYNLWRWVAWLPWALAAVVFTKAALVFWAWNRSLALGLVGKRSILRYFGFWMLSTVALLVCVQIAIPDAAWLRHLCSLLALLAVPLAGPALAMLALLMNRTR